MELDEKVLKNGEWATFELRALYQKYGYAQYKMSKFEEYDLYVNNKDFLVGDGVITFNDTDGKLLALKPDVTLSIVKKTKDQPHAIQKVYYNENVYRISGSTHTFKEIMQTGLECIGDIDLYAMTEVVALAVKSLQKVSENYVLDLSHLGVVSALVDLLPAGEAEKKQIITCIGEKNPHGIKRICEELGAEESLAEKLITLTYAYGEPISVYRALRAMGLPAEAESAIDELETITDALSSIGLAAHLNIDFSVTSDMNYYSGIVFQGFADGISEGILSGGRYDGLMQKMGRRSGAIGFAVYLDKLERLDRREKKYDVDIVLLYDEATDAGELCRTVEILTDSGKSVIAEKTLPEGLRYRRLLTLKNGGLEILETND